jgi:hypothetical protein
MTTILQDPEYRYRRILFPAMGWMLAPHGGTALVLAFAVIGLAGVALSAASLAVFPGARAWLPLTIAVTPGVIAALAFSLSDCLALGFTLAAFAAAMHQRWVLVVVTLTLGALTRESVLLAALPLALTPGMPARVRAITVAAPVLALGSWMLWVDRALADTSSQSQPAQPLGRPLMGWIDSTDGVGGLLLAALIAIVIAAGVWRSRSHAHVCAYLVLLLMLMVVLSPAVTGTWIDTSRAVIAGFPLAAWAITAPA